MLSFRLNTKESYKTPPPKATANVVKDVKKVYEPLIPGITPPVEDAPEDKPGGLSWGVIISVFAAIICIIIMIGGGAVYVSTHSHKSSSDTMKDLGLKPLVPSGMRKYLEVQLQSGKSASEIKKTLVSSGWKGNQIDAFISYLKIEDFVVSKVEQGIPREAIRKQFEEANWPKELIDRIFL